MQDISIVDVLRCGLGAAEARGKAKLAAKYRRILAAWGYDELAPPRCGNPTRR